MNMTVIVGATAASVGIAAGYLAGRKHAQLKFDQMMEQEIAAAKEYFSRLYKADEYETPESAAEALGVSVNLDPAIAALKEYQGRVEVQDAGPNAHGMGTIEKVYNVTEVSEQDGDINRDRDGNPIEVIEENVFEKYPHHLELDVDARTPDVPYIITIEEWMENDLEHNQIQVTWYEGDRILADERDDVIEDWRTLIGADTVEKFGVGCDDENTVMIRNERRHLDIEVARSDGRFSKQVAGFDSEESLQHSDGRMRRRRQWVE
jgi:hypothetical protein